MATTGLQPSRTTLATQLEEMWVDLDTLLEMQNPLVAMLTGKLKMRGFQKMGLFGKLFAEPKPNRVLQPIPA